MAITDSQLEAIAKDLDKRIETCKETLTDASRDMELFRNSAETYNRAWKDFAAISAMMYQFTLLRNLIEDNNAEAAELFIRFTVCQIQRFNNAEEMIKKEATGDTVIDGMLAVYIIFKSFLNRIDSNSAKSNQ